MTRPLPRRLSLPRLAAVPLCAAVVALAAAAAAATGGEVASSQLETPVKSQSPPGLDSALAQVARSSRPLSAARSRLLDVAGRKVRVTLRAAPGQSRAMRALVRNAGGSVTGEAGSLIDALVWPGSLPRLATAATVERPVRPVLLDAGGAPPLRESSTRASRSRTRAPGRRPATTAAA